MQLSIGCTGERSFLQVESLDAEIAGRADAVSEIVAKASGMRIAAEPLEEGGESLLEKARECQRRFDWGGA